jgi:hypothetical protein
MTFLQAAIEVLRSSDRPLTVREITEMALAQRLLAPLGRTPIQTMAAALYTFTRSRPGGPIERLYVEGRTRAARGTVRWSLRAPASDNDWLLGARGIESGARADKPRP